MDTLKSFALAEVKAAETDNPSGEFEAILSAPTKDRDGETIKAGAFDPLPAHITIDVDHGLSTATTVGSGEPFYDGDLLKIRGTFSSIPRAQEVRTLVTEGHIRSMSVAFMGRGTKSKDGVIEKAELLNAAFVPVPSNREAAVLMVKAGARNSQKDAERLQQAHDLMVEAGATCTGGKALGRAETKAVAGSYEDRQEDIREALAEYAAPALAAAYPSADPGDYEWRLNVVATFDDHVVYRIGYDTDDAWSVAYTWDGEEVTITGTPEAVTVDQVVTPAAPEDDSAATAPKAVAADIAPAGAAMRATALVALATAQAAAI